MTTPALPDATEAAPVILGETMTIQIETELCVECGTDTRIDGYINRVARDTGAIDGYNCGSCNDAYEAAQGLDHTLYEKYEKERHTEIDAMFPDAPAFREWCQRDTNENLSAVQIKQIQALIHNYKYCPDHLK